MGHGAAQGKHLLQWRALSFCPRALAFHSFTMPSSTDDAILDFEKSSSRLVMNSLGMVNRAVKKPLKYTYKNPSL